ncbi:MAG: sigma-70 family RNA polymerase sigma factor [Oscillospiraceae bacterium]|nr:sigma-70 family RNA polymerase sigma factor [Oscillospiraceae bacterium]
MTDEQLIRLLRDDPERGFAALISAYSGYVYTIAANKLNSCGTPQDIEEAVSDVFLQFYQWMQAHPDADIRIRALLAVIAKRHCINRFYALTRQPLCDSFEHLLTEPADGSPAPDESVLLMQAVLALGEPESGILLRRYYFGQSSKEIGEALGMKPNTVDKKISRSLKKLREQLLGDEAGEAERRAHYGACTG